MWQRQEARYRQTPAGRADAIAWEWSRIAQEAEQRGDTEAAGHAKEEHQRWLLRKETAELMEHGEEIRAWRNTELRRVVEAIVRVAGDRTLSDLERQSKRRALEQRYLAVDQEATRRMRQWATTQMAEAERIAVSEPALDAAGEARALRRQMQVDALARQYADSDPKTVREKVLGEAQRYLGIGAHDMAQVWANAAGRLGVRDAAVDQAIDAHLDSTLPHRKEAKELRLAAEAEHNTLALAVMDEQIAFRIGSRVEVARLATRAELLRHGVRTGVTTPTVDGREKQNTPSPIDPPAEATPDPRDVNAPLPA